MMKLVNQEDPKWASVTIGHSSSSIKRYGCTISCLSMLSDWYGKFFDPKYMAKNLVFNNNGEIIWNSITDNPHMPMKFVWRYYGYDEAHLLPALKGKDTSVLLRINLVIKGKTFVHWVVGIRKVGNLYYVADPLGGYRHFINRSAITGFTVLEKR